MKKNNALKTQSTKITYQILDENNNEDESQTTGEEKTANFVSINSVKAKLKQNIKGKHLIKL